MKWSIILAVLLCLVFMGAKTGCSQTNTDITFTWTAPGDDGDQGTCSQYLIKYSTNPITEENWDSAILIVESSNMTPQAAGSVESLTVTLSLESENTYYFRLKAADEVPNWSTLSNEVEYTVPDIIPPAAVITFQLEI